MAHNQPNGVVPLSEDDLNAVRKVIDDTFVTMGTEGSGEGEVIVADKDATRVVNGETNAKETACKPGEAVAAAVEDTSVPAGALGQVQDVGFPSALDMDSKPGDAEANCNDAVVVVDAVKKLATKVKELADQAEESSPLKATAESGAGEPALSEQLLQPECAVAAQGEVEGAKGEDVAVVGGAIDLTHKAAAKPVEVDGTFGAASTEPQEAIAEVKEVAGAVTGGRTAEAGGVTAPPASGMDVSTTCGVEAATPVDDGPLISDPAPDASLAAAPVQEPTEAITAKVHDAVAVNDGTAGQCNEVADFPVNSSPAKPSFPVEVVVGAETVPASVEKPAAERKDVAPATNALDIASEDGKHDDATVEDKKVPKLEEVRDPKVSKARPAEGKASQHPPERTTAKGQALATRTPSKGKVPAPSPRSRLPHLERQASSGAHSTGSHGTGRKPGPSPRSRLPRVEKDPSAGGAAAGGRGQGRIPAPSPRSRLTHAEKRGASGGEHSAGGHGQPRFMQATATFKGKGGLHSKSKGGSKPAWVSVTNSRQDAGFQTSMQLKVSQINVGSDQNGGSRSITPPRDPHMPHFMQPTHSVAGKYGTDSDGSAGRRTPGTDKKLRAPKKENRSSPAPFY